MAFHNLIRPTYDETFSSWVTRCAINPKISKISERTVCDWNSLDISKHLWGRDALGLEFDFHQSAGLIIANRLGLDEKFLTRVFSPHSQLLLSRNYRTAYCHRCIEADVAAKRYPSWRKSWCYVLHTYCLEHRCLLSHMENCETISKQWWAFIKGDLGDYLPGRSRNRLHGLPSTRSRAWLTLRIQSWIAKLQRSTRTVLPGTSTAVNSEDLTRVVYQVICMLLAPRTDRDNPGLARTFFTVKPAVIVHKFLDLQARLDYGARNSVPYERMSALLLLGLVFKVFTRAEIAMLKRLVSEADFELPGSMYELGALTAIPVAHHEYDELRIRFSCPYEITTFLGDFLDGLLGGVSPWNCFRKHLDPNFP